MKKIILAAFTALLTASLTLSLPARAATTDFTASADITVTGVTIDQVTGATVNMIIFNASTAESWSIGSGTFSVTNPGTFNVGSSDTAVRAIQINNSGIQVSCSGNGNPGTTTVTLPTTAATYTVVPRSTECGGGGGSVSSGGGGGGGGGGGKYQTYNPATGELTTGETAATPQAAPSTSAPAPASVDTNLAQVKSEAATVASGNKSEILALVSQVVDTAKEQQFDKTVVSKITAGSSVSAAVKEKLVSFVTYGTPTTQYLGAGERGGVVNSFKAAFGKIPQTDKDWEDVVKIGNGRWPGQTSKAPEDRATLSFQAIYKRAPVRANSKDDAAVVVMSYGLRPRSRNLDSEKAAINSYRAVFGRSPATATAWDAVRAIAYSGAKR